MGSADWIKIKNEYINTDISYRKLAEKHNASFATLQARAKKENWKAEHDKQYDKTMTKVRQKTADVIVKKEVDRVGKILDLSDKLMEKAAEAVEQLDSYLVKQKKKIKTVEYDNKIGKPKKETITEDEQVEIVSGIIDALNLKHLANALKDLKDIQTAITSDAQIEKLDEVLEKMGGDI